MQACASAQATSPQVIYPTISIALALGSYLYASRLATSVYDAAAARHGLLANQTCTYPDCFSDTCATHPTRRLPPTPRAPRASSGPG